MAKKIVNATVKRKPRSGFTQIYNSFLDSDLLTQYEKLVFIAIKSYANNKTKEAYPSIATISRVTGTSISQVKRCVAHMEELGILEVTRRRDDIHGNIQNLYKLHEDPEIWKVTAEEDDDLEAVAEEITDAKLIAELNRRGYTVINNKNGIKKEPIPKTDQSLGIDTFSNQLTKLNSSMDDSERQADQNENYTLEELKTLFGYSEMIAEHPEDKTQIDYVLQIIYDTVNSGTKTVRVQKTNRPKNVVIGVLTKLTGSEILYVIKKFKAQTERIKYPKSYLLTQLYEAKGQYDADLTNEVNYDLNND